MAKVRGKERFKNDAARSALIAAGIEILVDRGVAPGLSRVTLKEAIERSGVPRTTAYRVFSGDAGALELFHEALIGELDAPADVGVTYDLVGDVMNRASPPLEECGPEELAILLREMLRVGFNHRVNVLMAHAQWRAYVSSVAALGGDRELAETGQTSEPFAAMLEMLGSVFGLRPTPPFTWAGFAELTVAAVDGAALRTLVNPAFDDFARPGRLDPQRRWNGAPIIAEGLFLVWCEPDPLAAVSADLSTWTRFEKPAAH